MADFIRAISLNRLSREDMVDPRRTEEKFRDYDERLRAMAERRGLPLAPEDMYRERVSGMKLSKRPETQRILEMARNREFTHLLVVYQSRLTRGDSADEAVIEGALLAGEITLCLENGDDLRFDEQHYTPSKQFWFTFQNKANRWYGQEATQLRKDADRKALLQNKRRRGIAPYGYKLVRAPRDVEGKVVPPTQEDVARGYAWENKAGALHWQQMVPDPDEWEVLQEILRRVRAKESRHAILRDLNARHIPSPGLKRMPGKEQSGKWSYAGISSVLRNTAHAGRLSQRSRNTLSGDLRQLPREEWVVAPAPGPWQHSLSYDQFLEMAAPSGYARSQRNWRNPPRSGELSGLLRCERGTAFRKGSVRDYHCRCADEEHAGNRHRGYHVNAAKFEEWAHAIVETVLGALPRNFGTKAVKRPERPRLAAALREAEEERRTAQAHVEQLMRNRDQNVRDFGAEAFAVAAAAARKALEAAGAEVARLSEELSQPDLAGLAPLLEEIRTSGPEHLWRQEFAVRRAIIVSVIRRIDLRPIPEGRRYYREAAVTLHEWAARVVEKAGVQLPPLPVRTFHSPRNGAQKGRGA